MISCDLAEAKAINKSLTALGDVVAALTAHDQHVPYRNSKLTQLMSDSLGGSAKTLMIVNVSPLVSDVNETRSSLDYALRVKQVKITVAFPKCTTVVEMNTDRDIQCQLHPAVR